jgi:hypothetical protein
VRQVGQRGLVDVEDEGQLLAGLGGLVEALGEVLGGLEGDGAEVLVVLAAVDVAVDLALGAVEVDGPAANWPAGRARTAARATRAGRRGNFMGRTESAPAVDFNPGLCARR